jgi:hypothetical protein
MEDNRKKLIQLRTKLEFYKKLDAKITLIMNAKLDLEDYGLEIYNKVQKIESELNDYKMELDLPDSEWDEDETKD